MVIFARLSQLSLVVSRGNNSHLCSRESWVVVRSTYDTRNLCNHFIQTEVSFPNAKFQKRNVGRGT